MKAHGRALLCTLHGAHRAPSSIVEPAALRSAPTNHCPLQPASTRIRDGAARDFCGAQSKTWFFWGGAVEEEAGARGRCTHASRQNICAAPRRRSLPCATRAPWDVVASPSPQLHRWN